jgi:hypothetical protein
MRILLINVPHPSIGSRIPDDHLPPLGLLAVGGPLIDDGHDVRLIDAEFGPMSTPAIVAQAIGLFPDAVLWATAVTMLRWQPRWGSSAQGPPTARRRHPRSLRAR